MRRLSGLQQQSEWRFAVIDNKDCLFFYPSAKCLYAPNTLPVNMYVTADRCRCSGGRGGWRWTVLLEAACSQSQQAAVLLSAERLDVFPPMGMLQRGLLMWRWARWNWCPHCLSHYELFFTIFIQSDKQWFPSFNHHSLTIGWGVRHLLNPWVLSAVRLIPIPRDDARVHLC